MDPLPPIPWYHILYYNTASLFTFPDTQKFTPFLSLPSEIRIKIWHHALSQLPPRVVEIRRKRSGNWPPDKLNLYSPHRIPALLHTCRESRFEALKLYELAFGVDGEYGWRDGGSWPDKIFVNWEKDVVFFGVCVDFWCVQAGRDSDFFTRRKGEKRRVVRGVEKVQQLALMGRKNEDARFFSTDVWSGVRMVVVLGPRTESSGGCWVFGREPVLRLSVEEERRVEGWLQNHVRGRVEDWEKLVGGGGEKLSVRVGTVEMGERDRSHWRRIERVVVERGVFVGFLGFMGLFWLKTRRT